MENLKRKDKFVEKQLENPNSFDLVRVSARQMTFKLIVNFLVCILCMLLSDRLSDRRRTL